MTFDLIDTIAAISSAPGGATRGIVRVSGPQVVPCLSQVFHPHRGEQLAEILRPTALPGELRLHGHDLPLPADVFLWPTARSYTRQPLAEIHTLGSPPLLEWALETLCRHGARLAQAGEFTLRAFLAGRLDLTRAEAVLGVIDAANARQLDVALRQLAGGLSGPLADLREQLLELLAHLEAGLDFVEEDIEFISTAELKRQLYMAQERASEVLEQISARNANDELFRVALVGWPNVGKSSLFNALAGTQALISPAAGTTRDYLTATIELDGLRIELVDTAGIAAPQALDGIEAGAQSLSQRVAGDADLTLLCLEAARPPNAWEAAQLDVQTERRGVVLTKCDCVVDSPCALPTEVAIAARTSAVTRRGLDDVRTYIRARAGDATGRDAGVVAGTAARCGESLRLAVDCLSRAHDLAAARAGEELVAADVRLALHELGKIVGAIYTDDVLDRVFSRFCIGK